MIIDENGIQLKSFTNIFDDFIDGYKRIYGEDINLSQDTPDGQVIGITSNVVYDLETYIARVYNSFDPDAAEGHELDKILKLLATTRLPASKSLADIEIVASKNVELPNDYIITDENNQNWIITQSQVLISGTNIVSFESENWGSVEAQANTINKQKTIYTEVVSVNNSSSAIAGRDEETDIELRTRRNRLLEHRATSTVGSITGKILALNSVEDVIVYENKAPIHDEVRDIDAHSMWIIADGGNIEDITKIIATDKTVGCGLKGSIEDTYIENFLRSDGTTRAHYHSVNFDRPTENNFLIRFNVTKRLISDIIDTQAIRNELVKLRFNIAQNITITELYSTIYKASNNYIASDLEVSRDSSLWIDDLLEAGYDERLIITKDNIIITEI